MTKVRSDSRIACSWLMVARTRSRFAAIRSSRPVSLTGARPSFTASTDGRYRSTTMSPSPRVAIAAAMLATSFPSPTIDMRLDVGIHRDLRERADVRRMHNEMDGVSMVDGEHPQLDSAGEQVVPGAIGRKVVDDRAIVDARFANADIDIPQSAAEVKAVEGRVNDAFVSVRQGQGRAVRNGQARRALPPQPEHERHVSLPQLRCERDFNPHRQSAAVADLNNLTAISVEKSNR